MISDTSKRRIKLLSLIFLVKCFNNTVIFKELYNNSSSGANLTPYSGVIFWGVIFTPKKSLKNSFPGVKVTPDIEKLK